MTDKERIEEIEAQIEQLKAERKALKGSSNIAYLVDRKIKVALRYGYRNEKIEIADRKVSCAHSVWPSILELVKELYKEKHPQGKYQRLKITDLTSEEKEVGAEMATEIVDIWNKYVQKVYGDEANDK